ncbi:MAG: phosphoribosylanthranilate isomerase [Verrucomicrobiales bacterium]|nr:phosphoribosylanthranilate isomerase [Verrucomicrobiales bacterium]
MTPDFVTGNEVGIKICGIRSLEDAMLSVHCGANSLGFNFWSKSKRYITRNQIQEWIPFIGERIERVGVFVNADPNEVISLLEDNIIHVAQFHGDESSSYCEAISEKFKVIRAVGVKDAKSLAALSSSNIGTILLDAYCPDKYGGTGHSFEWNIGERFVKENPQTHVILAGGLDPSNVSDAIKSVRPSAVDVASGVENDIGFKDPDSIRKFISAIKNPSQ